MPKILVVDDEPNNRLLMEDLLSIYRDRGIELLFAEDGQEALDAMEEHHPEIVFLDVVLPERDGYDVCATVRKKMQGNDIHIILLTAKSKETERARAMAAGADGMIQKPFKAQAVFDVVLKVLGLET